MALPDPGDPRARPLLETDVSVDPLAQLASWFEQARAAGLALPEAMTLATATLRGAPSARMVLVKSFDERGFVFHTNYESRKGRELAENPLAALVFYWHELGRQVRVEGTVRRIPAHESQEYFRTRPLGARISAWASRQSEPLASREDLEARVEQLRAGLGDDPPPPPFWGGLRLAPDSLEFWQHRADRLHDRLRYTRSSGGWILERLAP